MAKKKVPRRKKEEKKERNITTKQGRPKKEIDEKLLESLAKLHLHNKTIAEILEIHPDTLRDRYSTQIAKWQSLSKGKMAEVLFDEGVTKRKEYAVKMLAQKHLGYADKVQAIPQDPIENLSDEELDQLLEQKQKQLGSKS